MVCSLVADRKELSEVQLSPVTVIWVMPWGRGNLGYFDVAETDVWSTVADAVKTVNIDPDRHYLTGFSMGGGGTWHLGIRTPDRWAAICVYSGGMWGAPAGRGLGINLETIPVRIAHGEEDGAISVQSAFDMQTELQDHGVEPDMLIIPGLGHTLPQWLANDNTNWLLQYRRKRPDTFSYVVDTDNHRGIWGIWLNRELTVSALPRFDCRIEGQTVTITTEGTKGLSVDLGENGMQLTGEVTVIWNGEVAYQGPVQVVQLGDGPGR